MSTRRRFLRLLAATSSAPLLSHAQESADTTKTSTMHSVLVLYRPGPNWLPGKPLAQQPLREHGRYMLDLYRQGALRMAGGFGDDSGGAALLNVPSIEAAHAYARQDPAVVAGTFVYEVRLWNLVAWDRLANPQRP